MVDVLGQIYRLLRGAKREWHVKDDRVSKSEMQTSNGRNREILSGNQKIGSLKSGQSEFLRRMKWVWVLHRADELEREEKRMKRNT